MSTATVRDLATLQIDVWTDFACPACYLAKPRLDAAIAATGRSGQIAVRYRAWELFPEATELPFDSFEYVIRKFGGDEARASRLEQRMGDLAQAQGQPYLVHHPIANSLDAHRALKLAAEYGRDAAFIDRLQPDLFGSGTDVFDTGYLVAVAADLGIPAERTDAALAGNGYADEVRADQARARGLGLTGIPFTVLASKQAIVGVASADGFRRAIEAALTGEGNDR
jgi:predicted DsbA family dithiol-disulfide isomerase